jgi:hypothetical protein
MVEVDAVLCPSSPKIFCLTMCGAKRIFKMRAKTISDAKTWVDLINKIARFSRGKQEQLELT